MKLDFTWLLKNTKISNLVKMYSVGAELIHAEGQTHTDGPTGRAKDMTKLRVAFRNFMKAPKKESFFSLFCADTSWKFSDVLVLRKACATLH